MSDDILSSREDNLEMFSHEDVVAEDPSPATADLDLAEPEPAGSDPADPGTVDGEGLLKRIRVSPTALSLAAVLANVVATEYGLTAEEREEIAVFIREDDLLIAADLDRGITTTHPEIDREARPRPMHLRFQVPVKEAGGSARRVGVRLRVVDLVKALRNRVENSENYGVLGEDTPVTLELFSDVETDPEGDLTEYPSRVVLHPTPDGSLSPREFPVLGGISPDRFEDLTPRTADAGLADLDAEALIDMAGLTDPDAGILLDPHDPAYLVGVSEQGITLSSLSSIEDRPEVERGAAETGRALTGPVVLSPRMATTLGLVQAAMEEVQKAEQRTETARHASSVVVAGLTAALDAADRGSGSNPTLQALRSTLGEKSARKALSAAGREDSIAEQAVRFAETLLAENEDEVGLLADTLSAAFEEEVRELNPNLVSIAQERLGGNVRAADLATAYLAGHESPDRLGREVAEAVGEVKLRDEARQIVGATPDARPVEDLTHPDYVQAAWAITGRRWKKLGRATLAAVPDHRVHAWWSAFHRRLSDDELHIPREAVEVLLPEVEDGGLPRPTVGALQIPGKLREQWIEEKTRSVQGRLWSDEDGRVHAGFGDADSGRIMVSDLAVRPDPEQFPLHDHEEIENLRTPGSSYDWKSEVPTADLQTVAERVTSLTLGRKDRYARELETLFVGRWTPPAHPDGPEGGVRKTLGEEPRVIPSNEVIVGEGSSVRHFMLGRSSRISIEDEAVAGTLRVFGFDTGGEHLVFSVPMTEVPKGDAMPDPEAEPPGPGRPVAFALDADQLGHLTRFVTEKGTKARMSVRQGLVHLYNSNRSRIVLLPSVDETRVPDTLRALVAAAGAERPEPAREEPDQIALDDLDAPARRTIRGDEVFEHARQLRIERDRRERTGAAPRAGNGPVADAATNPENAIQHRERPGMFIDTLDPEEMTLRQLQRLLDHRRGEASRWRRQSRERQAHLFADDEKTKAASEAEARLQRLRREIEKLEKLRAARQQISGEAPTAGDVRRGSVKVGMRRRTERELAEATDDAADRRPEHGARTR